MWTKISEFNDYDITFAPPIPAPAAIPAIAPETVVRLHLWWSNQLQNSEKLGSDTISALWKLLLSNNFVFKTNWILGVKFSVFKFY